MNHRGRIVPAAFATNPLLFNSRPRGAPRTLLVSSQAPGWTPSLLARSIGPVLPPPSSSALQSPLPELIRISPFYTAESAQFTDIASTLTPSVFWRFVLLSDGHIIQHLTSLTGHVRLMLLGTSFSPEVGKVQRRIALLGADGYALLYATSTWNYNMYYRVMAGREQLPLWEVFRLHRLEVSREISAVHFGICASLERYFDVPRGSGMWARDYVFRQNGMPFLTVHEVFSPRLSSCLGPVVPPDGIVSATGTCTGSMIPN